MPRFPTTVYGSYTFNGSITGVAFADFLLGVPFQSSRLVNPLVNRYSTQDVMAPFISDSFKVTDKLTLEFGLRWDVTTVPTFKDGLMYNFDPAANQVVVSQKGLSAISPLYPSNIKVVAGNPVPTSGYAQLPPARFFRIPSERQDGHPRRLRRIQRVVWI